METNTIISDSDFKQAIDAFLLVKTNEELKAAEKRLSVLTDAVKSIEIMLEAIRSGVYEVSIQKMLSVLLRKAVSKNYFKKTVEEKKAIKDTLLQTYHSITANAGLLSKLAEAYVIMFKSEEIKMEEDTNLAQYMDSYLNYNAKDNFFRALIMLQTFSEYYPNFTSQKGCMGLITVLSKVFSMSYESGCCEIYLSTLKSLFFLINTFFTFSDKDKATVEGFIGKIVEWMIGYFSIPNVIAEDIEKTNDTLTTVFETLMDNMEFYFEYFKDEVLLNLISFIISQNCLGNDGVEIGTKNAAIECLDTILKSKPSLFSKDNYSLTEKILKAYTETLGKEHIKELENKCDDPESILESFLESKLSDLIFFSIETMATKMKSKRFYALIQELISYMTSNQQIKYCLRLMSAIAQSLCHFMQKNLEVYVTSILLPSLKSNDIDLTINALKSLCYFCEFLAPDILDYKDDWLQVIVHFLNSASKLDGLEESQRKLNMIIIDNALFALEIIVDNVEKEEISSSTVELVRLIIDIMSNANLENRTKKTAIGTLSALFGSTDPVVLNQSLDQTIQILAPYAQNEMFIGETFICLSTLAYNALKDSDNKQQKYLTHFKELLEHAHTIINKVDSVEDYELYEGAFTVVYNAMELLERDAAFIFQPELFFKWIRYLEDAKVDDQNEPLSEQEDDEQVSQNQVLARLPFMHLCSSIVHYLGLCLKFFTEHVITTPEMQREMENFMIYRILSENEDERHQVYLCAVNYCLGMRNTLQRENTMFLLGLTETMTVNEASEGNVVRNFELLKDYFKNSYKDKLGLKPLSDPMVTVKLTEIISSVLTNLYRNYPDPEIYFCLCELVTEIVRLDTTNNYFVLYTELFPLISRPFNEYEELECDSTIMEELYGCVAESIKAKPTLLSLITQKFNTKGEFEYFLLNVHQFGEESITRNGMFLLGIVFESMVFPLMSSADKIQKALEYIQNCFANASNQALKDNCVSAFAKLYMNSAYNQFSSTKLSDQTVFESIKSVIPLKGDEEETSPLLKCLMVLSAKGFGEAILAEKKLILFMFNGICKKDKLEVNEEVFKAVIAFLSSNQQNPNVGTVFGSFDAATQEKVKSYFSG